MAEHPLGVGLLFLSILLGATLYDAATRLRILHLLPWSVLLILVGGCIGAGLRRRGTGSDDAWFDVRDLDPIILLYVFLPPLVWHAAQDIELLSGRRVARRIVALGVPSAALTLAVMSATFKLLDPDWSWSRAILLGAVASATDPSALFESMRASLAGRSDGGGASAVAQQRTRVIMQGESIAAAPIGVVLLVLLRPSALADDASTSGGLVARQFCLSVAIGLLVGLSTSALSLLWLARIHGDAVLEASVMLASTYLSYWLGELVSAAWDDLGRALPFFYILEHADGERRGVRADLKGTLRGARLVEIFPTPPRRSRRSPLGVRRRLVPKSR